MKEKYVNNKKKSSLEVFSDWDFGIISNNENGDLLGFYNKITDITICRPKYSDVRYFKNGFAAVKKRGKWGFINIEGNEITKFKYDSVEDFDNACAVVMIEIIKNEVYSTWKDNKFQEDYVLTVGYKKYGLINEFGKEVTSVMFAEIRNQSESMYAVKYEDSNLWGFINSSGNELTKTRYDKVGDFSNGRAAVSNGYNWGFIDKKGKVIVPFIYDNVERFKENMACICINRKWGFIDKTGKIVIAIKYDNAYDFYKESAAVQMGRKWGFINKTGRIVTRFKFDHVSLYRNEGFSEVQINSKWGFVNQNGKEITAIQYDSVMGYSSGFAAVEKNNKWGFINKDGWEVIPLLYDSVTMFKQNRSIVELEKKVGIINTRGRYITDVKYDSIYPYEDDKRQFNFGLAQVTLEDKIGFIDQNGKEIWRCS